MPYLAPLPSVLRILIVLVLDTIVLFPVDLPYPEDGVVGRTACTSCFAAGSRTSGKRRTR